MSAPVSVVVADDHPLFREGVVRTLSREPNIEVVGEAASAEEVLRLVGETLPDVALLDVSMPGGGIEAARVIAAEFSVVKVIMLTVAEDDQVVSQAMAAGATGYVLKGVAGQELISVIHRVHSGEPYITPSLAMSLLRSSPEPGTTPELASLTERERDILRCLVEGDSNKAIANRLEIGERTVKHHMTNILAKLQVRNRVEAALFARTRFDAGEQD